MINKVILIGNVGQDPEVRYTGDASNGAKVATIRLATTERYRDRAGNQQEHTEWHNVVVWRNQADVVERYVKKGTQLYIEGRIRTRSWTTRTATRDTAPTSWLTLSSCSEEDRTARTAHRSRVVTRDMVSRADIRHRATDSSRAISSLHTMPRYSLRHPHINSRPHSRVMLHSSLFSSRQHLRT